MLADAVVPETMHVMMYRQLMPHSQVISRDQRLQSVLSRSIDIWQWSSVEIPSSVAMACRKSDPSRLISWSKGTAG